jgi:hypothetical protein
MQKSTVFHEDVFYEHFRPFRHPTASFNNICGGHGLETFGEDLQLAFEFDENFVWTVVDGEGPDQWIIPGFHRVNRICFLLCEVPHDGAPIEFRIERGPRSLTPLGLVRRISTLKKILGANSYAEQQKMAHFPG